MMKKCLLIVIIITLSCCSCSVPEHGYNNDYQIVIDENENWFFEFDDEEKVGREQIHPEGFVVNEPFYTYIVFPSIAEMKTKITEQQLSATALCIIKDAFQRDAQNNIPIWNLDHLYAPVYPNSISISREEVTWYGTSYAIHLETQRDGNLTFSIGGSDVEDDLSEWIPSTPIYTETRIEGTNIVKFTYEVESSQFTVYRYFLENDVRRLYILDTVVVSALENGKTSTKQQIGFYTECDGIPCSGFWDDYDERPSEAELLSLGIVPFVPENVA